MPTISITNQVASQALRGQNVKVTVDNQPIEWAQLQVGQLCQNSQNKEGIIYSIDTYGNTFEVSPLQPDFSMSNVGGYLSSGEDLSITV
jgi:hypothetical protein